MFVLERAETMNDQAANKLLKTLEEPPAFAHLVLLTSRPGDLLRRRRLALPARALRRAAGRGDRGGARGRGRGARQAAGACARLALGDGERARALALGDGPALRAGGEGLARAALRDDLARAAVDRGPARRAPARRGRAGARSRARPPPRSSCCPSATSGAPSARAPRRPAAPTAARGTAALDLALSVCGLWLRDVACVADGAEDVVHATDRLDALREDAAGRDVHRLREAVALVDETRAALVMLNATEELALEALASRLGRAAQLIGAGRRQRDAPGRPATNAVGDEDREEWLASQRSSKAIDA